MVSNQMRLGHSHERRIGKRFFFVAMISDIDRFLICVFLQCKSVTSYFLNKKFVFVFQPESGNRIKPDQLRFVLLKNHSIYSKSIK